VFFWPWKWSGYSSKSIKINIDLWIRLWPKEQRGFRHALYLGWCWITHMF
jgi:hypothetical protein